MAETLDEAASAATAVAAAAGNGKPGADGRRESREDMLARHRQEKNKLQEKEVNLKKAAAKGSKAEQKAKKKQVDEEISRLSAELEARHAQELASLGYQSSESSNKGSIDNLVKAMAGFSASDHNDLAKTSKGARRRERRAQEEAAREHRIQEEQSNLISERMIENDNLKSKLYPLGLTINEIKPDGHCLYRAVEDQLSVQNKGTSPYAYQELREMAARYMREHTAEFVPFFLSENKAGIDASDGNLTKTFEKYCEDVESTAVWGGQLELGALTHCLKKHIVIYSGSFPDVEMGKEYKLASNPSIMLSYHRHAYGLGEHYNSVIPVSS